MLMQYCSLWVLACLLLVTSVSAQSPSPTFEQVLSLRSAYNPQISPDGERVVFQVRSTDWKNNRYDEELWLYNGTGDPFPLTNTIAGSSTSPQWSHDGRWIAFLSKRGEAEAEQVYIIRAAGGEAQPVTEVEEGISQFAWSPTALRLACLRDDKNQNQQERREEKFGKFAVEDEEYVQQHLWVVDVVPDMWPRPGEKPCLGDTTQGDNVVPPPDCIQLPAPVRLTQGDRFTVSNFAWSPDGTRIAFQHQDSPDVAAFVTADISIVTADTKEITTLVEHPGYDGNPIWSPDGRWIAYGSDGGDTTDNFYRNNKVYKIAVDGQSAPTLLSETIDENISNLRWNPSGMYALARTGTEQHVYRIDPQSGKAQIILENPDNIYAVSFSRDGERLALQGRVPTQLAEIYTTRTDEMEPVAISNMSQQIADWRLGSSEVITWDTEDGIAIEGVLHKPADYDPETQYPLMVVIHGGPTGVDTPTPIMDYVYPVNQWLNKGALVLRPNYRGSAGYGEAFRSSNVRNLGVGDAQDVLTGVDHLVEQGMVDTTRMAAMGWSQGGYISAFLTTHTNRFKAVSVGAGISNWVTYYVSTDIHPFTRQYLQADPWTDPDIYALTSPMTNITQATTPTLIQHGENDRRVPIANAYELYQGLRDMQVDTKLIVYEGFGHGINKPRERLAAVWHNWQWFARHIWEEDVDLPQVEARSGK